MTELNPEQIQTLLGFMDRMATGLEKLVDATRKTNDLMRNTLEAITANGENNSDLVELLASWPIIIPSTDPDDPDGITIAPVAQIIEMMAEEAEDDE
ncbi:hypothetical protein SEA_GENAMY16_83 [Gordonia phage Genamy16]|uniref:Uncharacterized protein n=2 Tax=Lambovirus TaxID=2843412 RepID=A0A9E7TU41_9CAUD|nr:hypothetical protein SEA_GENAMY16_83 [Gordonia phage Genamy16]UVF61785.1 hypothetical protein SEA_NOVASHARKS_82 [Gordonia phage NovaSharks]UVK63163.1 hypothetical protein SEA_RUMI_81 [Gordonia phage Rumi]